MKAGCSARSKIAKSVRHVRIAILNHDLNHQSVIALLPISIEPDRHSHNIHELPEARRIWTQTQLLCCRWALLHCARSKPKPRKCVFCPALAQHGAAPANCHFWLHCKRCSDFDVFFSEPQNCTPCHPSYSTPLLWTIGSELRCECRDSIQHMNSHCNAMIMFVSEEIVHVAVASSIGRPLLYTFAPPFTLVLAHRPPHHRPPLLISF